MRSSVDIILRLPKNIRIDSIRTNSIPIDENWMVTVRENHRNIDELPLKVARRKYA